MCRYKYIYNVHQTIAKKAVLLCRSITDSTQHDLGDRLQDDAAEMETKLPTLYGADLTVFH